MIHKYPNSVLCPLKVDNTYQVSTRRSSFVSNHLKDRTRGAATALPLDYPWSRTKRPCACAGSPRQIRYTPAARHAFQPPPLKEKISPNLTLPPAMPTCTAVTDRTGGRTDRVRSDRSTRAVGMWDGPWTYVDTYLLRKCPEDKSRAKMLNHKMSRQS